MYNEQDELQSKILELEKSKKQEQLYRDVIVYNSTGFLEANLSTGYIINDIYDYRSTKEPLEVKISELGDEIKFDEFEKWWANNMVVSSKDEFLEKNNCAYLVNAFNHGERIVKIQSRCRQLDGAITDSLYTYYLSQERKTQEIYAICVVFDITNTLREEVGRELFMTIYDSVFLVDLSIDSFTVALRKENTKESYGRRGGYIENITEWINKNVYAEDRPKMKKAIQASYIKEQLKDKTSFIVDFRAIVKGETKYYEMQVVRKDENLQLVAMGFLNRDDEVKKEMASRKALEEAYKKAEIANEAKRKFLFNMSHDIRTPMNAIMGLTRIAKENIDKPDFVLENLNKILTSSDHLLSLINNILDMSKIESGKILINEEPASFNEIQERVIPMVDYLAKEKGVNFTYNLKKMKNYYVYADVLHVNEILLNFLTNAIKYTNKGGDVNFTIEQIPSRKNGLLSYKFTIEDTGIGMSKAYINHVFEEFSRENTTTISNVEGAGLGMSIAKNLCDIFGGNIDIKSELGNGTTINCYLDFKEYFKPEELEKKEVTFKEVTLKDKRILLVEDNALNSEIATYFLEEAGIIVEHAANGKEAYDIVLEKDAHYYDVILMDIQMPVMDGYQSTMSIRSIKNNAKKSVPIIAMTANAFEDDKMKAIQCGMNSHIAKPIDKDKMLDTIKKVLASK